MDNEIRRRQNIERSNPPQPTGAVPTSAAQNIPLNNSTQSNMFQKRKLFLVGILASALILLAYWRTLPIKAPQLVDYEYEQVDRTTLDFSADVERRTAVVDAFKHAWSAYARDAWGCDEYHPIKQKGTNISESGGIGYTIIDALDTLHIMGLQEEFNEARDWVSTLSFDKKGKMNTFETTIRVLGGLLSAYALSEDGIFLTQAIDLAERMMPVFETPTGIPLSNIDLSERKAYPDGDNRGMASTAEATTLQLEFKYLSHLTDDYVYWNAVEKVMDVVRKASNGNGVVPIFIRPEDGLFVSAEIRIGSRGDSYYEYLLKQYLQTAGTEPIYKDMYDEAIDAIHKRLVARTKANKLLYLLELIPNFDREKNDYNWTYSAKQDHLVCFLGGLLLLGVSEGTGPMPPLGRTLDSFQRRNWLTGTELVRTCMETHKTETGLSPEIAHFKVVADPDYDTVDWYIKGADQGYVSFDARYILRPETVESLFYAWRHTGDKKYREWGWEIFQAIEKHCKISTGGYSSILNVKSNNPEREDKMETFFLSETLKYLYLLFSDSSVLPLSEYVFNTEAHPLPIFTPSVRTGPGLI